MRALQMWLCVFLLLFDTGVGSECYKIVKADDTPGCASEPMDCSEATAGGISVDPGLRIPVGPFTIRIGGGSGSSSDSCCGAWIIPPRFEELEEGPNLVIEGTPLQGEVVYYDCLPAWSFGFLHSSSLECTETGSDPIGPFASFEVVGPCEVEVTSQSVPM